MARRRRLSRALIAVSLAWIAAVGIWRFGDVAAVVHAPPVEIRYRSPLQVRFGLGHAPPGKPPELSDELARGADHDFVFPAATPPETIAREIDGWAALGNAVEDKLRAGAPLADYSDAELRRLAEMRGIAVDPARDVRGAADWNAELARPLSLADTTPYPLDGARRAAEALAGRPLRGDLARTVALWALLPPFGLLLVWFAARRR